MRNRTEPAALFLQHPAIFLLQASQHRIGASVELELYIRIQPEDAIACPRPPQFIMRIGQALAAASRRYLAFRLSAI